MQESQEAEARSACQKNNNKKIKCWNPFSRNRSENQEKNHLILETWNFHGQFLETKGGILSLELRRQVEHPGAVSCVLHGCSFLATATAVPSSLPLLCCTALPHMPR